MMDKMFVQGIVLAICTFILGFGRGSTEGRDDTKKPGASGTSVVEVTVRIIEGLEQTNRNLRRNMRFIRRLAWVETEDGRASITYSDNNYHGGIWRVDSEAYDITKEMYTNHPSIFKDIETMKSISINWSQTTWEDCRKPLYSALAARLFFHQLDADNIDLAPLNQAQLWFGQYHDSPPSTTVQDFVSAVATLENKGCTVRGIDLVFVLDSSTSVGPTNFNKTKDFVKGVVDSFDIGPDRTRVGIIKYSGGVTVEFHLNRYTDKALLKQAIGNIVHTGGGTNTVDALNTMESTGFRVANGARPAYRGLPSVAVVITDGMSQGADEVAVPSDKARAKGITMFAIGVTDNVNDAELNAIANKPNETFVFDVSNFDAIESISAILEDLTCNQPSPITTPTINSTLGAGQRQFLQQTVPEEGVTLTIEASDGDVVMFISTTTPNPNEALHDFRLDAVEGEGTVEIFIGPENFNKTGNSARIGGIQGLRIKREQVPSKNDTTAGPPIGTVYMTVQGVHETNDFILTVTEGDVTEPEGDVTEPEGEVTEPEGDVTEPEGDVTEPEGDVTEPTTTKPGNGCGSTAPTALITLIAIFTAQLILFQN